MERKVLFVCSRNKRRSLTAEVHFARIGDFEVASCGLDNDAESVVTPELVRWADYIFVMEDKHRRKLKRKCGAFVNGQRIICLEIPDDYDFMDQELINLLEAKVRRYLK